MKKNLGRVKFIAFLAITILLALIALITMQLITIHKYSETISKQQSTITDLNNRLDYFENSNQSSSDGQEIILGE